MNLTIDSAALKLEKPSDITIYFKNKIPSHLKWVRLKCVTIVSGILLHRLFYPKNYIYVNCDIIDTGVNLFNSSRSAILNATAIPTGVKLISRKFDKCFKRLNTQDFTSIRMYLTGFDGTPITVRQPFTIVYELEFM